MRSAHGKTKPRATSGQHVLLPRTMSGNVLLLYHCLGSAASGSGCFGSPRERFCLWSFLQIVDGNIQCLEITIRKLVCPRNGVFVPNYGTARGGGSVRLLSCSFDVPGPRQFLLCDICRIYADKGSTVPVSSNLDTSHRLYSRRAR